MMIKLWEILSGLFRIGKFFGIFVIIFFLILVALILWSKSKIASEKTIIPTGETATPTATADLTINLVSIDPGTGTARIKLTLNVNAKESLSYYEMGVRSGTAADLLDYQTITMNCSRIEVGEKRGCSPKDDIVVKIGEAQSATYPFDEYRIKLNFDIFQIDYDGNPHQLKSLKRTFLPSDTKINRYASKPELDFISTEDEKNTSIDVKLARPWHFRLLLFAIMLSIPTALVSSIFVQFSSAERELEALILNVTIFLGVPGIRGFLVPPELGYALWVDFPLLVSVILTFVGTGIFFWEHWKSNKRDPSTGQGS
jgi:hypothetical protein